LGLSTNSGPSSRLLRRSSTAALFRLGLRFDYRGRRRRFPRRRTLFFLPALGLGLLLGERLFLEILDDGFSLPLSAGELVVIGVHVVIPTHV
jgi:hypothetical protein